jgi:glutamyl-tRNA synthetase
LFNPDRSKLSKRQGDVSVEEYRSRGFLKEALVNFVALLGWNPGTEQEVFRLDELIESFSLERVGKSGAVFNIDKLNWLNFQHLRQKPDAEVLRMLREELSRDGKMNFEDTYLEKVVHVMRERVTFVKDFLEKSPYFFEAPSVYDPEADRKRWNASTPQYLKMLVQEYSNLDNPAAGDFEGALHRAAASLSIGNSELIHAVRLAVSGVGGGPGLFDILSILGKDESIRRLNAAIDHIQKRT